MRIRSEQLEAISDIRLNRHRKDVALFLRDLLPERTARYTDVELEDLVARAVSRAAEYRIETGSSFLQFIGLMLVLGPNFDKDQAVRRYLEQDIDGDTKLEALTDSICRHLRRFR